MIAKTTIIDRLTITCDQPDRRGACKIVASLDGAELHHDQIPPFENFRRAQCADAIRQKAADRLCNGSRPAVTMEYIEAFGTDPDDDQLRRQIGDKIVAAANLLGKESSEVIAPKLRCLADVQSERIVWLWEQKIPIGKLTIVTGDPGLGKSMMMGDITARTSTGAPWPDSRDEHREPAGVVIISAEDGLEDTIRPRLDAAGADVTRVNAMTGVEYQRPGEDIQEVGIDLTKHLPAIESAVEQTPGCKLLLIDPVTAYLGATDSHKNAEVRSVLARLSELAARCEVAIVAISHLNKSSTQTAIYRTMGSLAFVAAARAVWAVIRDKDDPSNRRRLFLPVKNNLGDDKNGLAYCISKLNSTDPAPVVCWEANPVSVSVDDAMAPAKKGPAPTVCKEAVEFLRGELSEGRRMAKELFTEAEANGISSSTLKRAKKELKIVPHRDKGKGPWWWQLPNPQEIRLAPLETLEPLGLLEPLTHTEDQEDQVAQEDQESQEDHVCTEENYDPYKD